MLNPEQKHFRAGLAQHPLLGLEQTPKQIRGDYKCIFEMACIYSASLQVSAIPESEIGN
jgi:hypothetical protein